jgi:Tripartite tricarboxylate transporter TctB family.
MVFAASVERVGLVPGVFLTVVIASFPDPSLRWPGKLVLGAVVALGSWGLFIGALGLPFDAFRGF